MSLEGLAVAPLRLSSHTGPQTEKAAPEENLPILEAEGKSKRAAGLMMI